MRSPTLAILWELWRRHRALNLALVAAIPISALVLHLLSIRLPSLEAGAVTPEGPWPVVFIPLGFSIIWVFGLFAYSESDVLRGFSGIPPRLFTLPVSTSYLIACLNLTGTIVLLGVYL